MPPKWGRRVAGLPESVNRLAVMASEDVGPRQAIDSRVFDMCIRVRATPWVRMAGVNRIPRRVYERTARLAESYGDT